MTNPTGIASRTLDFENLLLRLSMARGEAEIMAAVREQARPLIGADGISFVLRDHDSCYYADEDAIGPLWKGQRFPMDKCISGWSMLNRKTVIIDDIYNDNRIPRSAYVPTFVRSLVMVPVRHEDPVAAIGAYWAQPRRAIDYQEVETMQRIANSAAVAMTNVTLIKSLEAAKE